MLRGVGLNIPSVDLLRVNTAYVRGATGIAWAEFFARCDVGESVTAALTDRPGRLPTMREWLNALPPPPIEGAASGALDLYW